MQILKLPIQGGAYQNVDEVSLTNGSPALVDGYVNEAGSTVKRPGEELFVDLNERFPVDGIYWWDKQKCFILVCNKKVFKIDDPVTKTIQNMTGAPFEKDGLTIFAETVNSLFMANGKRTVELDASVVISEPVMTGSGADDLTVSGVPTAAASFHIEIDGADSFATAEITRTATNPAGGGASKITIGAITYTLRDTPAAAYDVQIGATAEATMDNLILAINSAGIPGTNYFAGTEAHPLFIAGVQDTNLLKFTITAILKGTGNNGVVLSTTTPQYTVPASTAGGQNNTFKWSSDGGVNFSATGVAITAAAQALTSGVSITFGDEVGHNLGDYWEFYTTATTSYLLPNRKAPDQVTHVAVHDTYLICNEVGSGRFHYSQVGAAPVFRSTNFANAESDSDDINAIHVAWREVTLFGRKSVEVWYDDGTTPFSRLEGAYTERGVIAPYSIQLIDNVWIWLDNHRRFSKMQGRTPVTVSTPFDKVIHGLSRVDDAYSSIIESNGRYFYVVTFPSDKLTLAYDWSANQWFRWGWWNQQFVEHEHFNGRCHAFSPDWGVHLVGDRTTGKVYQIDEKYYTDAGNTIRTIRRTGHVDHGTSRKKMCKGLQVKLKRGAGDDQGTEPKLMVRWRNDNGLWSQLHEISLGKIGDNMLYGHLGRGRSLGTYRARQWEFSHTDNSSMILVEAEELVEVLGV